MGNPRTNPEFEFARRLRSQLSAEAVVAGYIHELSAVARPGENGSAAGQDLWAPSRPEQG